MLVVVHPHLEDVALHAGLVAELLNYVVVMLLNPPPQLLRQLQHLILLLLREFRPIPLLRPGAHVRHVVVFLASPGRRRQSQRPLLHVQVPRRLRPVILRELLRVVGE